MANPAEAGFVVVALAFYNSDNVKVKPFETLCKKKSSQTVLFCLSSWPDFFTQKFKGRKLF